MRENSLYKLQKKDIERAVDVLTRAFYDYPMFRHILGEKHSEESTKTFLRFLVKYSVLYGQAYASSPQFEGVVLYTDYDSYSFNFIRSIRSGALSFMKYGGEVGKRFGLFNDFTLKTHKRIIKEPHQYVVLIGVDPEKQGQGFGCRLMDQMLKEADEKGHASYLETHGDKNVELYKRFGYEVVCEELVPGSHIAQYSMLRKNK